MTIGSTVESLVELGASRARVMRAVDVLYPGHKAWFRSYGIPAISRELGGSGLFKGDPAIRKFAPAIRKSAKIHALNDG